MCLFIRLHPVVGLRRIFSKKAEVLNLPSVWIKKIAPTLKKVGAICGEENPKGLYALDNIFCLFPHNSVSTITAVGKGIVVKLLNAEYRNHHRHCIAVTFSLAECVKPL